MADELVAFDADGGIKLAHGPLLKGLSEWTGGAYSLLDDIVQPRSITPIHKHEGDTQVAVVISGKVGTWVEGSGEIVHGAGGYSLRPAGKYHAIFNPTDEPAHVVEITTPGEQFETFMRDLSRATETGETGREQIEALARAARITFTDEHLDRLVEKYGLTKTYGFWK